MQSGRVFLIWALCSFSATSGFAQSDTNHQIESGVLADIILYNANVITFDDQNPSGKAVALAGRHILAIGTNAAMLALQTTGTQLFDLEGKTVLPGLIEAHDHWLNNAFSNTGTATESDQRQGLKQAVLRAAARGYTTVHEIGFRDHLFEVAQELAQDGELAARINLYIPYNSNCGEDIVPWDVLPYTEAKDVQVRLIGIKIFADGGSCQRPAVTVPYVGGREIPGTYGDLFRTQDEMNDIVKTVLDAGYPIAMHAIGDSAIGVGLNAFEFAFDGQGNVLRSRMEHLRVMREDLVDQMAALGIGASIQYSWARSSSTGFENVYEPQVLEWLFPWRRMADRGIPIIGGNDFPPTGLMDAMPTISLLATRQSERGAPLPDWLDGDQLTVEEAFRAMTVTNAWVAFEEDVKGTITPGKLADIVVLSDDPMAIDPFDVRFIDVEMTIMDGVVRHNQLGEKRLAVHDAGTFSVGIDDRGLWGQHRAPIGFSVGGISQLYQGSILISYDDQTVATATLRQQDYATTAGGFLDFQEPGVTATEQARVIYEDVSTNNPNSLRVIQDSYMWDGDPLLLVDYAFENPHDYQVDDVFFGSFMSFNINGTGNEQMGFTDDLGGWDENQGLGFAYMYDDDPSAPYIGVAIFDRSGSSINNALTFRAGFQLRPGGGEVSFAAFMRSGVVETDATPNGSYSILLSIGPYSIEPEASISPFMLAFVVGKSLDELRDAVNLAYQRSAAISTDLDEPASLPDEFRLFQSYPNPFNPSTTIKFQLPKPDRVRIEVFNVLGQRVALLLDERLPAGIHRILFNAENLSSGLYIFRVNAGEIYATRKMIRMK